MDKLSQDAGSPLEQRPSSSSLAGSSSITSQPKEKVEFVETQRNTKAILRDGFLFYFHKSNQNGEKRFR